MSLSIDLDDLQAAITEAYRFIGAAKELEAKLKQDVVSPLSGRTIKGVQNAAAFRKSMDLTRALSHLRRRKPFDFGKVAAQNVQDWVASHNMPTGPCPGVDGAQRPMNPLERQAFAMGNQGDTPYMGGI